MTMTRTLLFTALFSAAMPGRHAAAQTAGDLKPLVYEVEDYTEPKDAWLTNKGSDTKWTLWTNDKDAAKKWSGGVVLRSPVVKRDRETPEDGAPPLHTHITGIPRGSYEVEIKMGRTLAVSHDGKKWEKRTDGRLGLVEIADGSFDVWVDDRYANEGDIGPAYYDCITFRPIPPRLEKPKVAGFAHKRVREKMGRGIVAMPMADNKVYVGWRLLANDPKNIAFNLYRRAGDAAPVRLNAEPVRKTTDFVDANPPAGESRYFVRAITGGGEGADSETVVVTPCAEGRPYISIKLDGNHTFQKAGIADLDGDGRYDFVIKQPHDNIDPYIQYWQRSPDTYKLEAYRHDGKFLWRHDLGWSIERGIWYSPYVVYDFDGDGRAEVAVKIGESDPRDADGRVTSGPEWLAILDGQTGKELARAPWPSRERFPDYNYFCRNQIGVAYLDGKTPCIIVERGTYNVIKLAAYEFHGGKLRQLWTWEEREESIRYRGQGAHCLRAADVDGDGRDEVIIGSAVIDDNGVGLWSTGMGHPDNVTVGQLDPSRPGLQIHYDMETRQPTNGICMVDAKTGKILWGLSEPTKHIHSSGLCADIDPAHPGCACYGGERDDKTKRWLFSAKGELISTKDMGGLAPRAAYWDTSLHRALLTGHRLAKFDGKELSPRIEGEIVAVADILGDWREEIITSLPGELRIYSTTIPAADRRPCLMQDPIYRLDAAGGAQGYYQIPGLSRLPSANPPW